MPRCKASLTNLNGPPLTPEWSDAVTNPISNRNPTATRRVLIQNHAVDGKVSVMPAPHKGDRLAHTIRPPREVSDALRDEAASHGLSLSQYVADLLAIHVGRPDLARDLGRPEEGRLPLAM